QCNVSMDNGLSGPLGVLARSAAVTACNPDTEHVQIPHRQMAKLCAQDKKPNQGPVQNTHVQSSIDRSLTDIMWYHLTITPYTIIFTVSFPASADGQWSLWSTWTNCSVSHGDGVVSRTRSCSNPSPVNGGNNCAGLVIERKSCQMPHQI
ncbi:SEM5A-like protein, partial [Mya arenaria]